MELKDQVSVRNPRKRILVYYTMRESHMNSWIYFHVLISLIAHTHGSVGLL